MRTHKYINNPKDLLVQGTRIVLEKADNEDNQFIYRVSIVNFMLSGLLPEEPSSYCEYRTRTLQFWLKNVDESGGEILKSLMAESFHKMAKKFRYIAHLLDGAGMGRNIILFRFIRVR